MDYLWHCNFVEYQNTISTFQHSFEQIQNMNMNRTVILKIDLVQPLHRLHCGNSRNLWYFSHDLNFRTQVICCAKNPVLSGKLLFFAQCVSVHYLKSYARSVPKHIEYWQHGQNIKIFWNCLWTVCDWLVLQWMQWLWHTCKYLHGNFFPRWSYETFPGSSK